MRSKRALRNVGGEPVEMGQAVGTAHRVFMEARTLGNEDTKGRGARSAARRELSRATDASSARKHRIERGNARVITAQTPRITADRDRLTLYANSLARLIVIANTAAHTLGAAVFWFMSTRLICDERVGFIALRGLGRWLAWRTSSARRCNASARLRSWVRCCCA